MNSRGNKKVSLSIKFCSLKLNIDYASSSFLPLRWPRFAVRSQVNTLAVESKINFEKIQE